MRKTEEFSSTKSFSSNRWFPTRRLAIQTDIGHAQTIVNSRCTHQGQYTFHLMVATVWREMENKISTQSKFDQYWLYQTEIWPLVCKHSWWNYETKISSILPREYSSTYNIGTYDLDNWNPWTIFEIWQKTKRCLEFDNLGNRCWWPGPTKI